MMQGLGRLLILPLLVAPLSCDSGGESRQEERRREEQVLGKLNDIEARLASFEQKLDQCAARRAAGVGSQGNARRQAQQGQRPAAGTAADAGRVQLDLLAAAKQLDVSAVHNRIDPNKVHDLPIGRSPVLGPADAPVTITVFSDYQCVPCAAWVPLIDQLLSTDYANKLKLVHKNYPLSQQHPDALDAARAAVAAGKQGKYWEMYRRLYAHQSALGLENLKLYAAAIGLDVAKWEAQRTSGEVEAAIDEDVKLAAEVQVVRNAVFVNGKRLLDRSPHGFKAAIDQELKAGGSPSAALPRP
jgi:protein-disulfide isomerase